MFNKTIKSAENRVLLNPVSTIFFSSKNEIFTYIISGKGIRQSFDNGEIWFVTQYDHPNKLRRIIIVKSNSCRIKNTKDIMSELCLQLI